MVHLNVVEVPGVSPSIVVLYNETAETVPLPETVLHSPVPEFGLLAVSVVEFTLQRLWSDPAFAFVGGASFVITTSSNEGVGHAL